MTYLSLYVLSRKGHLPQQAPFLKLRDIISVLVNKVSNSPKMLCSPPAAKESKGNTKDGSKIRALMTQQRLVQSLAILAEFTTLARCFRYELLNHTISISKNSILNINLTSYRATYVMYLIRCMRRFYKNHSGPRSEDPLSKTMNDEDTECDAYLNDLLVAMEQAFIPSLHVSFSFE